MSVVVQVVPVAKEVNEMGTQCVNLLKYEEVHLETLHGGILENNVRPVYG